MNKIIKSKEKQMSKNTATEGKRLMKKLLKIEVQLELHQQIIEQKKDGELQLEKVEKCQRRKLNQNATVGELEENQNES